MKTFRDNGAIGALLDEYEKSVEELKAVLQPISFEQLTTIIDPDTKDPDCRSIQTILNHVVGSGFGYAIYIRCHLGETLSKKKIDPLFSIAEYQAALDEMFQYNVQLFEDYPNITLEEYDASKKMRTSWNQLYDVEQIIEHAIVHVLRHRRQIERFLLTF